MSVAVPPRWIRTSSNTGHLRSVACVGVIVAVFDHGRAWALRASTLRKVTRERREVIVRQVRIGMA
jgi:hypothetical protein